MTSGVTPSGLKERGQCDALFRADADDPRTPADVGVVEVEGGARQPYTAKKLAAFFGSPDRYVSRLQFAILLLSRFGPRGRGAAKGGPLHEGSLTADLCRRCQNLALPRLLLYES